MVNVLDSYVNTRHHLCISNWLGRNEKKSSDARYATSSKTTFAYDYKNEGIRFHSVSLFYKVNNLLKISNRFQADYHNNCVPSEPYLENNLLIV